MSVDGFSGRMVGEVLMGVDGDLEVITRQEELLRWDAFDADVAWRLGGVMREMLVEREAGATVEIEVAEQVLFACATVGAKPTQTDWIRRKRNMLRRVKRSTYAVGRMLERDGETMEGRYGLAEVDYAAHGGGFPIWVGGELVGSAIVSGLPQREDHHLVVAAMAKVLGVEVPVLG